MYCERKHKGTSPLLVVKLDREVCNYLNIVHLECEQRLQLINHMANTKDVIDWGDILEQHIEIHKNLCIEKQLIFDELQSTLPKELVEQYPDMRMEVDFREEILQVYA